MDRACHACRYDRVGQLCERCEWPDEPCQPCLLREIRKCLCRSQWANPMNARGKHDRAAAPFPHLASVITRFVGQRKILTARKTPLQHLQPDDAALRRIDHELRAHSCENRLPVESHQARHDTEKTENRSTSLVNERAQRVGSCRVQKYVG